MRFDPTHRFLTILTATLLVSSTLSSTMAADGADTRARALSAYDAGDCREALPLLQQIDAAIVVGRDRWCA